MAEGVLQGKVAIVTGSGSPKGIGHAITMGLVSAGARVAMMDINETWLEVWPESHWPGFALRQADAVQSYTAW